MSAEYIVSSGNPNVILCERGIRTFETYTRNTLDLAAIPLLHHLTHLPVIVDPSHATGKRWLIKPMALAGVAAGADGVMVEVHPRPDEALSDGEQSITLEQFADAHGRAPADPRPGQRAPRRPGPVRGGPQGRRSEQALNGSPAVVPRDRPRRERRSRRSSGRPRACAANPACPATSRSAIGRSCSRRWPTARARSTAPATARTSARPRRSIERLGVAAGATLRRRPTRRVPGRLPGCRRASRGRRRPRLRELGDDAPAHGWDPGRARARPTSWTATIHCGADRWPVSSNRCARWAPCSMRAGTIPFRH